MGLFLISYWGMQIQWLGLSAFRIQTQHSVIVTDPFADSTGLQFPKLKADIVTMSDNSSDLSNNVKRLSGDPFVVEGPGEYEVGGSFIYGIPTEPTIYVIEDEGMTVAHLGALGNDLTEKQLHTVEGADILLLPLGSLEKSLRAKLISKIEPRIIIPYLHEQKKVKGEAKKMLAELEPFLKEMGVKDATAESKFSIKKKDLPQEETIVTVLSPQ